MTDIKLTLRKDASSRAPNIEAEAKCMAENGPIYYSLQERPQRAEAGCWVYFVREGELAARSRADEFRPRDAGVWEVACSKMHIADHPFPHPGFQGFHYVTDEEEARFKQAFKTRSRVIRRRGGKREEKPIPAKPTTQDPTAEKPPLKWTPG